ncbi:hypothetical protein FACS189446_8610 [Bacteroidia bacterium]|nr:hypothetical protein FACS189446_8610 [Bacteroidia bacterium]
MDKDEPHYKFFSLDKAIDIDAFQQWKADLPMTYYYNFTD